MMDKAVLAEFIYDYPVTVMTMIALWLSVLIIFSMQAKQQAVIQRQQATTGFPWADCWLPYSLANLLRIPKIVINNAPNVIDPRWYLFIVQDPLVQ